MSSWPKSSCGAPRSVGGSWNEISRLAVLEVEGGCVRRSTRARDTRIGRLREPALGLGDERCELALAPVESPLALAQHLLPLLDLLEPEVRFQLVEGRPQVGIARQVVCGNPAAIPDRRLPVAGETRALLLDLCDAGDEGAHRLDLARELSLQALGVRVEALLPAEELDGQCVGRTAEGGERRL